MRKCIITAIMALACVAYGQTFTDIDSPQYTGKTDIQKAHAAIDANFALIEGGSVDGSFDEVTVNNTLTAISTNDATTNVVITADGEVDGETIADDTIDDDSIDFSDVTAADITFASGDITDGTVIEADLAVPETDGLNVKRIARQAFTAADLVIGSNSLANMDIPDNAVVDFGYIDVTTICSSTNAGSTFTLSLQAAEDLYTTVTGDVAAAITAIIPVGTAGSAVKTTAAANPWIDVTVGDYTSGVGVVVLEYTVSD